MGVFENRQAVEAYLASFTQRFFETYYKLHQQRCPTLWKRLPLLQGVCGLVAYATDVVYVVSRDSTVQPLDHHIATWDETEYAGLSTAHTIEAIVEVLELEEVLYWKELDSLEPDYLDEALGLKAAEEDGEKLLEDHMHTIQPRLEDAADRMQQAYGLLFLLENNLRQLIEQQLKRRFGDGDWWEKGATHAAKEESDKHQRDPKWKWHESIQASPLNYVDFATLHDIIVKKNWGIFEGVLGPQTTFSANFQSLYVPRNVIAHNNVLSQQEFLDFCRTAKRLVEIVKAGLH
jgi:hypothetical protein